MLYSKIEFPFLYYLENYNFSKILQFSLNLIFHYSNFNKSNLFHEIQVIKIRNSKISKQDENEMSRVFYILKIFFLKTSQHTFFFYKPSKIREIVLQYTVLIFHDSCHFYRVTFHV